ncbi:single-stranded-DNA-specific exonuclease RecJ [Catenovulum maritimum]|uniref:Single-stranded-DNA-specific exonuclease RecJ n=1 Tax=Catenovulum maritimum TaxID=1513271 RepID=A0A0J8GN64_9ALTE|nr:single-stranded-DNA-specific exonuclease RecJ [Catenovulum maritimum]KMT64240.1 ssDNA exonuclease RecJ [Catenovulum maritimum]
MQIERRLIEQSGVLPDTLHPVLKRVLVNRGISQPDDLNLSVAGLPEPSLKGLPEAVELLHSAIIQNKKIFIIGDFDADGATSTALMLTALKSFGAKNLDYLVPNRFDFGYGLSVPLVDMAVEYGAEVLVTVDNGIACIDGVNRAKSLGLEVIITDHHLPGNVTPKADAIVNPNQNGCDFPSKNIAGVGVAFYLILALRKFCRDIDYFAQAKLAIPNVAELLDLVALGTVADVVALDNVNRILVQQGINRIRKGVCRPGIKALLDVAEKSHRALVSSDLAFALGPRLNAAGRLDDMTVGISCLMAENYSEAMRLAARLDGLNRERREIEHSMQVEAVAEMESLSFKQIPFGICLYKDDWHQGVIGILAGRIKERFHRPTVIFAEDNDDILKGSCRSIKGFHIRDALEQMHTQNPDLIIKFGGHAMAAGLSIHKSNLDRFKQIFDNTVEKLIQADALTNKVLTDGALQADEYSIEIANLLKQAMPWGQCFEAPIFDDEFKVAQERLLKDKHLKLVLQHASGEVFDAIWFNYNPDLWQLGKSQTMHAAFSLDTNTFRGKTSVQLMIHTAS